MEKINRVILCIDLKSFFASVECVDRNMDYFKVPLAVADTSYGNGSITLAITPYLKSLGVKSRSRIYELPKHIKVIFVKPRMNLYLQKSKEVVNIYLNFVSKNDLHIYSIDECFLDVTNYLKLYKTDGLNLAKKILKEVYNKTGLCATCGIGPNMLLAKLSMDIEAKKNKDFIAKWTYEDVESKLWPITPLSKIWGIGPNMEKRLNNLGIKSVYDLAHYDVYKLKSKFGIMGEELWNHANGIDNSMISDKDVLPKEKSISHSQILHKDYDRFNIKIIIEEMCDTTIMRLKKSNYLASSITLGIRYSKEIDAGFHHRIKLAAPTDSIREIKNICLDILDRYCDDLPIRKVSIHFGDVIKKTSRQLNIFYPEDDIKKEENIDDAIYEIKDKFGLNSLVKASCLLSDSTQIERNKKIGGHNA